jgi:hypothetical protein
LFIYIFAVLLSILVAIGSSLGGDAGPSGVLALLILFVLLLIAGVYVYAYGLDFAFKLLTNTKRLLGNQRFQQVNGTNTV